MYVILGATGNTGSVVAETLLANGQKVRVVGRSKERLAKFGKRGAEVVEADITKPAQLKQAFHGAKAVYAMIPPNINSPDVRAYQSEVTDATALALEAAGVTHAVTLSSVGANEPDKTGPVVGLHLMEERFAQIPNLNALHIRAGYFMENTLPQAGIIKNFGMMAGPVRDDLALPLIASHDIGVAAAEELLKLDFQGQKTRELLGPRDLTYADMAKIVGKAIGKPDLNYVQLPDDQILQALTQMGMSKNMASLLLEMTESLNNGHMRALEARSAQNTTPTKYEDFVQRVFVPAYKGQATSA